MSVQAPQPPAAITVRMYRGLLGDCFLLTQTLPDRPPYRALIDCGVLQCIGAAGSKPATKAATVHMQDVATSLAADTGGVLDLVVATHEHYDHLSGFLLAFDTLKALTIKKVWMAWTENPTDSQANQFRKTTDSALSALAGAVKLTALAGDDRLESIRDLLQFYGDLDDIAGLGLTGKAPQALDKSPRSCAGALDWLKLKAPDQVSYLEPGEVVKFGLDDSLTAYVLGPPRTMARLKQLDPSAGAGREVYLTKPDEVAALQSTLKIHQGQETIVANDLPFSTRFSLGKDETAGFSTAVLYDDPQAKDRRIDAEWLGSAETLALKIDGDVNNTSLALAIEAPGGDVLLFPADAQVGNWLSWHDQTYPAKPAKPDDPVRSAPDILSRVVFYKVGHHASHNATARAQGLELMTSPHLAAMIPVVETVAHEQKSKNNPAGWSMPYPDLYARLLAMTQRRVVRGDGQLADEQAAFQDSQKFQLSYDGANPDDPLWAELRLATALPVEPAAPE
ncbi:hypothetical protein QO010_002166 [Caulobacter ginsengisoli]|uniref:Metallo-beta-lactamase domain-containing protein n=1 Tax=Caulobacter ginsengisoli TaxID=400775 RepID=A0ABU0ISJ5_9CAUL|nr:hypothetical protein [Caulobacter ginsengisoli]MDQ0464385.1 hypothetical protein [Caulobacter ginsengisoli]